MSYFEYKESENDYYGILEKMKWEIRSDMMLKSTPMNWQFYTMYDGTGNLTTLLNAPVIATKGHYY